MITSVTESAEAVKPALTSTCSPPMTSPVVTVVKITVFTPQPRIKSLAFSACRRLTSRHEFRFVKWFQHFSTKMRPTRSNVRIPEFNGPARDDPARISDRYTPYANFSVLLALFIWPQIFPKTRPGRRPTGNPHIRVKLNEKDRSPQRGPTGPIIILFHYNYNIFFI